MDFKNELTRQLGIDFPMIMAPMFLVSNERMMKVAIDEGIMGVFPSLNYRKEEELAKILENLRNYKATGSKTGNYGVNLIVQKSNPLYEKHLQICVDQKVPFYITSLGNPRGVIQAAHEYGAKVFCDVTNLVHAKKCMEEGADGFIAVGQGAGGHAGPNPLHILVPTLKENFPKMPVIAAGGIATGTSILSMIVLGASAVSVGTRFIASEEAEVSDEYKRAIVNSGMEDIVLTTKISGTPCTIINTPYAKEIGYEQNWFEKLLSHNSRTKRWFKMLIQLQGFRRLQRAIQPGTYKTLWCAGQSVEMIHDIVSSKKIIEKLKEDTASAYKQFSENSK